MEIVYVIAGLVGGIVLGFLVQKMLLKGKADKIISDAEFKAESIKKDKMFQAKERFLKLKQEHETKIKERERRMQSTEDRAKAKENKLEHKLSDINRKEKDIEKIKSDFDIKYQGIALKMKELDKTQEKRVNELSKISGMSAEDAKESLMKALVDEAKTAAMAQIKEITEEAKLNANKEARKIVIQSIQRVATEQAIENAVSVFNIDSDEVKGRIIGREGRNIRALEAATGVEIIVDDTPEAIMLSCFDPVRREIARLALHQLVTDGRIHPARIEEIVAKTRKQLDEEIAETGKRTCIDLGIHGLHPALMKMVGRMKYRSSYGQNLLKHSREVANLCATMASELGLNPKIAKRAGLLHDIGKAVDHDMEGSHDDIGADLVKKYNEPKEVIEAVELSHSDNPSNLYCLLVQASDAISAARPGARKESYESYVKRVKELEDIASSFNGVDKCFAIQAGREVRVMVESDKINDDEATILSHDIAKKIEDEVSYPGNVKITVVREVRTSAIAN